MSHATSGEASRAEHGAHVMTPKALLGTAGALLALTALTVSSSRLDLGEWNVVVALAVACTKAALVAAFFMHLKYEQRSLRVILASAALFAVLFVAFVIFDTTRYQPDIRAASQAEGARSGGEAGQGGRAEPKEHGGAREGGEHGGDGAR